VPVVRLWCISSCWSECFSCFGSRHSATIGASIDHSTSTDIAKTFVGVSYRLYLGNKEFYHSTLFVLTSLTNSIVMCHSSSVVCWKFLQLCI